MMMRSPRRLFLLAASALVLLVGVLFLTACGEDADAEGSSAVLNAINILDRAGLHDLDDSINVDKTVPGNARTTAQQLQAVTSLTEWPTSDLESQAEVLAGIFAELAEALDGDNPDLTVAGEAAKKAHDAEHDFSHDVWEYLYEEAGVTVGEGSHE